MDYNQDAILGETFSQNPYQYLQNYIRNMNNQIFLSEYQINNLYALLLIGRSSPWDGLRTSTPHYKLEVNELVEKKIKQVKYLLDNMSQLYQDKVKKATFNQIQRLMSILKAKNKSIFIEKCVEGHQSGEGHEQNANNQSSAMQQQKTENILQQLSRKHSNEQKHEHGQHKEAQMHRKNSKQITGKQAQSKESAQLQQQRPDALEVFGLIQGIGNIPNLSALALGNCLEYNTSQRYIKFKMTKNYIMTIKNDDPVSYDLTSRISKVPACVFVNHIFPYLTAWELFRARSVCREWFGLVKDSWHSTFKRQMYIQLLAGQFCKDIQFFYKCIQLRNPFFQKLSLLLHALIQIIQWQTIIQAIQENRLNAPCKRVLLVLLKLLGQNITINNFNDLTQQLWQQHKTKIPSLRDRVVQFFANFSGNSMTINQLRALKINVLDHAFMRGDEMQTQQKTPLLLLIFIKQLNLQQILKNHLHFSQQYMLNSKNRLDSLSAKMPHQRGFLEGVYKILLLKSMNNTSKQQEQEQDDKQMPNFHQMLKGIFQNVQTGKPDFYIKTKSSKTSIYMDRATKLDIIISTVRKSYGKEGNDMGSENVGDQLTENHGNTSIEEGEAMQEQHREGAQMEQSSQNVNKELSQQQNEANKQKLKQYLHMLGTGVSTEGAHSHTRMQNQNDKEGNRTQSMRQAKMPPANEESARSNNMNLQGRDSNHENQKQRQN